MLLYVMRHGPAEGDSPTGRDFDRRLTPHGRQTVDTVAKDLASRGDPPPRILSSPLTRAVQTAEIVRAVLGVVAEIEIRDELAPSENAWSLVTELGRKGAEAVLFVGHAPDVSELVAALTDAHAGSFSAGMIVALDVRGTQASRRFAIEPPRG